MGYFGEDTLEQNILEDVLAWQQSHNASDARVVLALCEVFKYFCEDIERDNKEG